ncbi:MAG: hypothetical protein MRK00_16240 [Nitrosomonas sp.]|nr:hypothetical protein [Nitrosomonas sp.]
MTKKDASNTPGHIDDAKNSLAARVKECMGNKSVSAFARECDGMNESTLRYILSGSFPRTDHLTAIANASGVTIDWLATGKGIKNKSSLKEAQNRLYGAPPSVLNNLPQDLEPYRKRLDALLGYIAQIDDEEDRDRIIEDFILRAHDKIKLSELEHTVQELRAAYKKNHNNSR